MKIFNVILCIRDVIIMIKSIIKIQVKERFLLSFGNNLPKFYLTSVFVTHIYIIF